MLVDKKGVVSMLAYKAAKMLHSTYEKVMAQILWRGHMIADVTYPTMYFTEASTVNFRR